MPDSKPTDDEATPQRPAQTTYNFGSPPPGWTPSAMQRAFDRAPPMVQSVMGCTGDLPQAMRWSWWRVWLSPRLDGMRRPDRMPLDAWLATVEAHGGSSIPLHFAEDRSTRVLYIPGRHDAPAEPPSEGLPRLMTEPESRAADRAEMRRRLRMIHGLPVSPPSRVDRHAFGDHADDPRARPLRMTGPDGGYEDLSRMSLGPVSIGGEPLPIRDIRFEVTNNLTRREMSEEDLARYTAPDSYPRYDPETDSWSQPFSPEQLAERFVAGWDGPEIRRYIDSLSPDEMLELVRRRQQHRAGRSPRFRLVLGLMIAAALVACLAAWGSIELSKRSQRAMPAEVVARAE